MPGQTKVRVGTRDDTTEPNIAFIVHFDPIVEKMPSAKVLLIAEATLQGCALPVDKIAETSRAPESPA